MLDTATDRFFNHIDPTPERLEIGNEIAQLIAKKGISYREAAIILEYVDALLQDAIISSPLTPKHK